MCTTTRCTAIIYDPGHYISFNCVHNVAHISYATANEEHNNTYHTDEGEQLLEARVLNLNHYSSYLCVYVH